MHPMQQDDLHPNRSLQNQSSLKDHILQDDHGGPAPIRWSHYLGAAAGSWAIRHPLISVGDPQASTHGNHPALSSRPDRLCLKALLLVCLEGPS